MPKYDQSVLLNLRRKRKNAISKHRNRTYKPSWRVISVDPDSKETPFQENTSQAKDITSLLISTKDKELDFKLKDP